MDRPARIVDSAGFVAIDLGSLRTVGAMHAVGAPLSGVEFHFIPLRSAASLRPTIHIARK
jgi:hypothetical protein